MRAKWVLPLLVSIGGCTAYQPVAWQGHGSWAQAQATASTQATPSDSRRPIASKTGRGAGEGRHVVQRGETLSGVAERYRTPLARLAKANGVKPSFKVYAGQVLAIPRVPPRPARTPAVAVRPAPIVITAHEVPAPARPEPVQVAELAPVQVRAVPAAAAPITAAEVEATRRAALRSPPSLSGDGFLWPVRGQISSAYGAKPNGARNDGINIRAAAGTPVLAAENGVVVYAGDEIPGYGEMLLISHAGGLTTAYAHNGRLLVRVGAVVERGQQVATVGRTGDVTSPQLHFELRDGKEPLDPVAHLEIARTRIASAR